MFCLLLEVRGDLRRYREYCRPIMMHKGSLYFLFFTIVFLLLALSELVSSSTQQLQTKLHPHKEQVAVVSDDNDIVTKDISFLPVVYVSLVNTVINILRPDPSIIWQVSDMSLLCT